jgi:hypothetical protein
MTVWINGRMIPTGANQSTSRKICPSAHSCTTKPNKDRNVIEPAVPKWEIVIAFVIAQPYVSYTGHWSSCYNLCRLRGSSQLGYIRRKASTSLTVARTRLCATWSLPNFVPYIRRLDNTLLSEAPDSLNWQHWTEMSRDRRRHVLCAESKNLVIVQWCSYSKIYT